MVRSLAGSTLKSICATLAGGDGDGGAGGLQAGRGMRAERVATSRGMHVRKISYVAFSRD